MRVLSWLIQAVGWWRAHGDDVFRLLATCTEIVEGRDSSPFEITPPIECPGCGAEPFIVRWGAVRLGQSLDGYYARPTVNGEHSIVCRECWERALGVFGDP